MFTGNGAPRSAGGIYEMDGSSTIYLTNNLYVSNGTFIPVQWYNEEAGIQTFAVPGLETFANYGFRFPF